MSDADAGPHIRHVVQQEPEERFFKIEEHKLICQNHIAANITFEKGVHAVSGNKQGDGAENVFAEL